MTFVFSPDPHQKTFDLLVLPRDGSELLLTLTAPHRNFRLRRIEVVKVEITLADKKIAPHNSHAFPNTLILSLRFQLPPKTHSVPAPSHYKFGPPAF